MRLSARVRPLLILPVLLCAVLAGGAIRRVQDTCGPFTDVSPLYCPYVLEAYYTGITAGTSATTFSPDLPITRAQSAVFTTKALNQALARGSRRASLGQWWTTVPVFAWSAGLGTTSLPSLPIGNFSPIACDGADVWVAGSNSVFRVRASDGRLLETWTTENTPSSVLVAMGRVLVAGWVPSGPGALYAIDPTQPAGAALKVADIPESAFALAFDGARVWVTNFTGVSIVTPGATAPWSVTNITTGFQAPSGILFDGQHLWVTDSGNLLQLDPNGAIVMTVDLGGGTPSSLSFDGQNVLVPNGGLQVVRPDDGAVIANVSSVGAGAYAAVFDGERILVVSSGIGGQSPPASLTLLRAADYSMIAQCFNPPIGGFHFAGGASDGLNFWLVGDAGTGPALARY